MFRRICLTVLILMCASLLFGFALTTLNSVALKNSTVDSTTIGATTPSTGVFTTVGSTTGLARNTGIQYFGGTTCTTAAATNANCTTTFTWNQAFADTSYSFVCQLGAQTAGSPGALFINFSAVVSASQGSFNVQNAGPNANASAGNYTCLAWHNN